MHRVQVGGAVRAEGVANIRQQKEGRHLPLTPFTIQKGGEISLTLSRAPWAAKDKATDRSLPIAVWGLVFLPRYTGGVSQLPYLRGHLRHETFTPAAATDGDSTIGP